MTSVTRASFRLRPPELPDGLVYRERLLDELRQRFVRRVTILRGGAGFGKTTLLAHAVTENLLDPMGTDVWLQVVEHDRQPGHLLGGLMSALSLTGVVRDIDEPTVDDVVDLVWARAPVQVALLFDDVHMIDGWPSWAVVTDLCERLPANAHLVLNSRTPLSMPVRALQAQGQAAVLEEPDLAFDDSEQAEFVRVRHVALDGVDLPSWPALAVLMSTVGHAASIEFLWDAVLQSLQRDRRRALALVVRFGRIDDELVEAVLGSAWSAKSLLDGLPLVESRDGDYRFHDLWRAALADEADDWRPALACGAEVLIARGEMIRGVRCLEAAGATDRIVEVARWFGATSISAGLSGPVAEVLISSLPVTQRNGALGRYLRTIATSTFQSDRLLRDLDEVYRIALEDDDPELATLALFRRTQLFGDLSPALLSEPEAAGLVAAVKRYAGDGWPQARCALALIRSHAAEQQQDVEAALEAVSLFDGPDPAAVRTSVNSRYVALGHPERVAVSLEEVLRDEVSEPVSAQAVWLRGEIDPTVAWPIVRGLAAAYSPRRLPNVQVPLLGVLTSVALAAGDIDGARATADDALELARRLLPRPALFAQVADALVALAADGDVVATRKLAAMFDAIPLEPWPAWAYLGALSAARALIDGTEWLDELGVGPALAVGIAAGRAIVSLRRDADDGPARALPWRSTNVLRVQVPPSLLCELALAACNDEPAAQRCLELIPHRARWVQRVVEHPHDGVRSVARAIVARSADRPPYDLEIVTFGDFAIRRTDGVPVTARVRGGRVHQLLAHLLVDEAPLRTALAERLWPELGEQRAATNLRVTLASLLDAIEPDRRTGTSWFTSSENGRLRLAGDGLNIDVRRFHAHAAAARAAERAARLTIALDHHRQAFELYAGEFMPGVDDSDVETERLRLQTLAYNSGCRLGELLLAKGEPEEALGVVRGTARIDPLAERIHRVEIRCHLALGSSTAARSTARNLREMLRAEGLTADRETELLLDRADP